MPISAFLIAAALQQAAPAPDEAPVPREAHVFNDWVVACDNTRRCQAIGVYPEDGEFDANGILTLERGPEAEAQPVFRLTLFEGAPARLVSYGQPLAARLVLDGEEALLEITDRAAFMERISYAERIDVQDANGAVIGQLSLAGLRGAMLYMDEVQGRLHTVTALVRAGRRPASDVPAAPPVPAVRIAPATSETPLTIPAARIARLRRDVGCAIADVGGPDEFETGALGGGRTLVLLSCGSGAYNYSGIPFIATRRGRDISIEPAPFDIPLEEWHEEGRRTLINPGWSAETMTLDDFSKGRGLGDCGSRSAYGWDGARFRLVEREEMPVCRGSVIYVTTWRAEIAR